MAADEGRGGEGEGSTGEATRERVIVVGAGPVGLSAALALRALGLSPLVLEADAEDRVRPGSRALFVHRESLRLLERMSPGLAAEMSAFGVVWRTRRTLYAGREVFARTYPPPEPGKLPPFISLRQVDTERFLLKACRAAGVRFAWGAEIVAVDATPREVTLTARDGRRWTADYVVAADGARSAVRRSLGIAMQGHRSEGFHVVVDVEEEPAAPRPIERVLHYEHPRLGGRTVLFVPFAGGFQVDLQCKEDDTPEDFCTPEAVRQWLPQVIDGKYASRVLWVSKYHFLQVVAETFTDAHRRVLLAGEAAHLFPPFGARGMNSGIADADAAAAAIATALAAAYPERAHGAIDDYQRARRHAAKYNSDAAGAALSHLRPHGPLAQARRRVAAVLAPRVPSLGAWLDSAPYGPRAAPPSSTSGKY